MSKTGLGNTGRQIKKPLSQERGLRYNTVYTFSNLFQQGSYLPPRL